MFFKALAEQNGGDFSPTERTLPPEGRPPPPHRRTNCPEAYFVLDGLVLGHPWRDYQLSRAERNHQRRWTTQGCGPPPKDARRDR
jgi:hypothetical protein